MKTLSVFLYAAFLPLVIGDFSGWRTPCESHKARFSDLKEEDLNGKPLTAFQGLTFEGWNAISHIVDYNGKETVGDKENVVFATNSSTSLTMAAGYTFMSCGTISMGPNMKSFNLNQFRFGCSLTKRGDLDLGASLGCKIIIIGVNAKGKEAGVAIWRVASQPPGYPATPKFVLLPESFQKLKSATFGIMHSVEEGSVDDNVPADGKLLFETALAIDGVVHCDYAKS